MKIKLTLSVKETPKNFGRFEAKLTDEDGEVIATGTGQDGYQALQGLSQYLGQGYNLTAVVNKRLAPPTDPNPNQGQVAVGGVLNRPY